MLWAVEQVLSPGAATGHSGAAEPQSAPAVTRPRKPRAWGALRTAVPPGAELKGYLGALMIPQICRETAEMIEDLVRRVGLPVLNSG